MQMFKLYNVVGLKALDKFKRNHSNCRRQIDEWINDVSNSNWQSFSDIKKVYPSASILNGNTVEEYNRENFKIVEVDPVNVIKFRMEQQGLRPIDMKEYFGSTGRFYDIMNKKRSLSLNMIRKLHSGLGIAYDSLIA
ncbi:MAG: type II toxin-antitoxin system HigB family toxin [Victivallaceae bacterium]